MAYHSLFHYCGGTSGSFILFQWKDTPSIPPPESLSGEGHQIPDSPGSLSFPIPSRSAYSSIRLSVRCLLTSGDDSLQTHDVGVIELSQNSCLAEEGAPLFLRAAGAKGLYGHGKLAFAGQLQAAAAHLAEVSCGTQACT